MRIAGYDDLRVIGRGGFGVVYQGRDRRFARDVAVKVLTGLLDETSAARFERECHAVGALSGHPHIVVVHDSGTTEDGLAFLVMELLAGGSLADRLNREGPQTWSMAAELGVQLAGALETAHRGGVLHRDVKPENVLFSAYRQPKLVDFGIATVRGGFETKSASVSASLAHAAPEILAGKRASVASDVYALGSTLFQVLTGRPAFLNPNDETLFPLLARIAAEPVPDLRPRGVPDEVAAVLEGAMAKDPKDRQVTALAFAQQLREAAGLPVGPVVLGEETPAAIVSRGSATTHQAAVAPVVSDRVPARRSRRTSLFSAAAVVLGLGAAAVVVAMQDGSPAGASTYRFAEAGDSTVLAGRTWSIDGKGTTLTSDLALTNPSTATVTRTALEVIPKTVASDVNQVTFVPRDVSVVDTDPVVRWRVTLVPGAAAHLRWTVRLPSRVTAEGLRSLALAQRQAEVVLRPRMAAIAALARVPVASFVPFPAASEPDPGLTSSPAPSPSATPSPTPSTRLVPSSAPRTPAPPTTGPRVTSAPTTTLPTGPPAPVLHVPGLPRSVVSGTVRVVARVGGDPKAQPSSVSVGVTWSAPSGGGAPASYCVRWTLHQGASATGSPSSATCVTGRSARVTVPHVNPSESWLAWEVQARNKAGSSGWSRALAAVPDLVGGTETDGVDQLRAAGLRVGFGEQPTSDAAMYCRITGQSPRSGALGGGSLVQITYYVCP
jgi:hypothetical protein